MLVDKFDRKIDYLRVSVTQRCNFRCQYCMPEKPFEWTPKEDLLSYEQMFDFIKVAIDKGIKKIRITGGEPLVRDDLHKLISMISSYKPDIDLAITTNAYLLKEQIFKLKEAGLKRVNISLDSLEKETFWYLSKRDALQKVLDSIEAALKAEVKVKINSVILKNINENEILNLYNFAKSKNIQIRFIEYMENKNAYIDLKTVPSSQIIETIKSKYCLEETNLPKSSAAKLYKDEDGYVFGIIEPYDDSFCKACNRIRLSANGDLIPCLYYEDSLNIKSSLHNKQKTENILKQVIDNRPEKNKWSHNKTAENTEISSRAFYFTGG
ncbi:GTP 3',8-cyclase MoaA [Halarcobacter anaerophilus]|uniref:GTP 3',8-cyclase n=1 Tax=Halarcobacter anaerophilus TaxID=877500 RepID=A0A4Q0Y4U3_9BACT|nr:GTP 3',8-cyclase MoaA [Halarcobacter anaerophilus]QDF29629.1 molybdenum cofactor biosynthesis protein A [Halarcobacter anaerophilus]RXJ64863.1 GTP 3',8-cyclase MoaA [Halarcobacter anaerophilus]